MFLWSREGFCHSMKISCGSTGEVLWYPAGEGILGGVPWIHRWARGGSMEGSGIRRGFGAGGKGPDPSALMETPLDYATPAAAKNLCSGMSGNVRQEIRNCCLEGFYPV